MAEIKVDLEAVCECGDELNIIQNIWSGSIKVSPCKRCMEEKYDEGFAKGQKED